jgi:nucleotide-binding universal stress UspA family protein
MFQRILVPLDGSSRAERALPIAARIARASGGSILLLRVVHAITEVGEISARPPVVSKAKLEAEIAEATAYLTKVTDSADLEGLGVKTEVYSGIVAPAILSFAQAEDSDLIVMCSHGETGLRRWMMGSIAQKVARHCPVPVLVLHEGGPVPTQANTTRPLRALVALDGSPLAEAALKPAAYLTATLSAPAQGQLHLVRVLTTPAVYGRLRSQAHIDPHLAGEEEQHEAKAYLSAMVDRLHKGDLAPLNLAITTSTAVDADVASALIRVAEHGEHEKEQEGTEGYDFVAIVTHGRSGLQRWAMGSVAERVLGGTKLPLLIVRPQKTDDSAS